MSIETSLSIIAGGVVLIAAVEVYDLASYFFRRKKVRAALNKMTEEAVAAGVYDNTYEPGAFTTKITPGGTD